MKNHLLELQICDRDARFKADEEMSEHRRKVFEHNNPDFPKEKIKYLFLNIVRCQVGGLIIVD